MIGFTLVPGLLLVAIAMALWTALRLIVFARVKQNVAGAVSLVAEILILAGFLFPMGMKDDQSIIVWNYVILVGLWLLIPSWLIFVMLFTDHADWVTRGLINHRQLFIFCSVFSCGSFTIILSSMPGS